MARLQFLSSLLLKSNLYLKFIAQVFLILLHLFHGHAKVFLWFDFFPSCLLFVSLAPFMETVGETLEVVDNVRYFLVSHIFLVLKLFNFFNNLFTAIMEFILELEQLMGQWDVVFGATFRLTFWEELLRHRDSLLKSQPVYNLSHQAFKQSHSSSSPLRILCSCHNRLLNYWHVGFEKFFNAK